MTKHNTQDFNLIASEYSPMAHTANNLMNVLVTVFGE
jgi:hypothetical protein